LAGLVPSGTVVTRSVRYSKGFSFRSPGFSRFCHPLPRDQIQGFQPKSLSIYCQLKTLDSRLTHRASMACIKSEIRDTMPIFILHFSSWTLFKNIFKL
jgi:hypothetical protein